MEYIRPYVTDIAFHSRFNPDGVVVFLGAYIDGTGQLTFPMAVMRMPEAEAHYISRCVLNSLIHRYTRSEAHMRSIQALQKYCASCIPAWLCTRTI